MTFVITLALADGSVHGKADPAFQAHAGPIGKWAEAVWEVASKPAFCRLAASPCGLDHHRTSQLLLAQGAWTGGGLRGIGRETGLGCGARLQLGY